MAVEIIKVVHDDLNPDIVDDVQALEFAVDGEQFVIDLGDENRTAFMEALAPFVNAARKPMRSVTPGGRASKGRTSTRDNRKMNAEIRGWAVFNGMEINERGRIPQSIVTAYHQAQADKAIAEEVTVTVEPKPRRSRNK